MSVRLPKYRLHRATGQAFIEIRSHRHYLGKHNTEPSKAKYREYIALLASGRFDAPPLEVVGYVAGKRNPKCKADKNLGHLSQRCHITRASDAGSPIRFRLSVELAIGTSSTQHSPKF